MTRTVHARTGRMRRATGTTSEVACLPKRECLDWKDGAAQASQKDCGQRCPRGALNSIRFCAAEHAARDEGGFCHSVPQLHNQPDQSVMVKKANAGEYVLEAILICGWTLRLVR